MQGKKQKTPPKQSEAKACKIPITTLFYTCSSQLQLFYSVFHAKAPKQRGDVTVI